MTGSCYFYSAICSWVFEVLGLKPMECLFFLSFFSSIDQKYQTQELAGMSVPRCDDHEIGRVCKLVCVFLRKHGCIYVFIYIMYVFLVMYGALISSCSMGFLKFICGRFLNLGLCYPHQN